MNSVQSLCTSRHKPAVGTWESGRRQWELGRAVGEGLGEAAGYARQGEAAGRREDRLKATSKAYAVKRRIIGSSNSAVAIAVSLR